MNHPEFNELLIPCLEFLTRAYGLSTELIRILTTYNENERESRLYTPHIGEKGLWTVLLGDGITRADHVLLHIINILKSLRRLHVFYLVVLLKILILNKRISFQKLFLGILKPYRSGCRDST